MPTIKEITKNSERIILQERIREVEKTVPYVTEKIVEVEMVKEKPVAVPQIE
jgi:hypothetical protein